MRKPLRLLLVAVALVLLVGWLTLLVNAPKHCITKRNIERIQRGMTQSEVEAVLGGPPGDYSGGCSIAVYFDLAGATPFLGKEGPGVKFLDLPVLHAVEWVGDEAAVKVWFDGNNRVFEVVPGRVMQVNDSFLDKLRRWLGL